MSAPRTLRIRTFAEFWPFYLGEHRRPLTRAFHFAGTNAALVLAVAAVLTARPLLLLAAVGAAYALAWISHYFIEKNRPATFRHPLWSFAGDWKMWAFIWTRRLAPELHKAKDESLTSPEPR